MSRLIVVSNRLPVTLRREEGGGWSTERSAGGLATAMNPILRRTGGLWIGWSGETEEAHRDPERADIFRSWKAREGAVALELPGELGNTFYEGYPNRAVWPLFHYFPTLLKFEPEAWDAYVEANGYFAKAVAAHARPGDLIWVHDYHLMLLPRMLREAMPDARIGFFLHIPFPSSEVFGLLPRRDEVLRGLLGADLIAFHTHRHLQHFRSSLLRLLGLESSVGEVDVQGRTVHIEAMPIGIAPDDFRPDEDSEAHFAELRRQYAGLRVLIAVDRLDYTKGIPQRLRAFRRLLQGDPELRGKVVLIQIAVPSREGIGTYQDLRSEVNELVGEINGKLGTASWTPIVYINRGVEKSELVALYRLAEVGWVTPLRDGMNLVAKEYAATKPEGDGVLVLSEFAGAAAEMGEALMVNPLDEERTADAVHRALHLEPDERRDRMRALHERVVRNDVFTWGDRFLSTLTAAAEARALDASRRTRALDPAEMEADYRRATRRLLLLDYDGTLVPFAIIPGRASPSAGLLRTLGTLAADPANFVVLVSGRRAADLEGWFGAVPRLLLAAEHGAVIGSGGAWAPTGVHPPAEWKQTVRPILEHFVIRTPGSFVEEKEYSLVWHYRMAEPEFGEWLAHELVEMLESMLAETELRAMRGQKIVEVKPIWANKGALIERVLALWPDAAFRLAIGDDRTDEDLFARMDPDAWTVHVGGGPTKARFVLPGVDSVLRLLDRLANVERLAA
ncbi:MAG TPA: bifunctional alpha,alpha-trehalose-phosphate synthase (UDP-forming)/trehalose-phosphatase [Bryobacteraceae bacterium]|nr:bifunctional alpha,alpha-trehalose-phosphate synthase (UDP-forming)/trehalose-phosphatase [Bryobacteraceae bacterium]